MTFPTGWISARCATCRQERRRCPRSRRGIRVALWSSGPAVLRPNRDQRGDRHRERSRRALRHASARIGRQAIAGDGGAGRRPFGSAPHRGQEGEIVVRSATNTIGYLGDAAESAIVAGGWLRTGDLGHLDGDGYLYITGRLRSVIICGGFNVVPEEVEAVLIDGTTVTDAAVVGLPDPRLGEIPVAVVEPVQDPGPLLARLGERLVPYKRPRKLFSVDSLPRLPVGKVDRPAVLRLAKELVRRAGEGRPDS